MKQDVVGLILGICGIILTGSGILMIMFSRGR
jgi:hypothetical protein